MSIASLTLSNYIMIAELLGLWVMLESNVHLNKRTITATRIVIILIFTEALFWAIERWTREIGYLTYTRIILTPTVYLLHPIIMLGIMDMAEFVKKRRLLLYLPILISAPLLYTSQCMSTVPKRIAFLRCSLAGVRYLIPASASARM